MDQEQAESDILQVYTVILSPTAEKAFKAVRSRADRRRIDGVLCVLDTVPGIGRDYDPIYEAAKPSEDVKVVYAGHFGIYYQIIESDNLVYVYYIEDQRRDPMKRFSHTN